MNHTSSSTTSNSLYTYSPQASPTVKSPPDAATTETRALARHTTTAYERIRTVGKGGEGGENSKKPEISQKIEA